MTELLDPIGLTETALHLEAASSTLTEAEIDARPALRDATDAATSLRLEVLLRGAVDSTTRLAADLRVRADGSVELDRREWAGVGNRHRANAAGADRHDLRPAPTPPPPVAPTRAPEGGAARCITRDRGGHQRGLVRATGCADRWLRSIRLDRHGVAGSGHRRRSVGAGGRALLQRGNRRRDLRVLRTSLARQPRPGVGGNGHTGRQPALRRMAGRPIGTTGRRQPGCRAARGPAAAGCAPADRVDPRSNPIRGRPEPPSSPISNGSC